jgi:small GTP-binding protein
MYYRGAKAAICVFDVTNEESFHRVSSWLRDLKPFADPNCVICLAGNKCDKAEKYDLAMCEELAQSMGATFTKTSALTGEGIAELFDKLSRNIADAYRHESKSKISTREADVMKLGGATQREGTKSSCC